MTNSLAHHIRERIASYRTRQEQARIDLRQHLEHTIVVDPDGSDTDAALRRAQELVSQVSALQGRIDVYQAILDAADIG